MGETGEVEDTLTQKPPSVASNLEVGLEEVGSEKAKKHIQPVNLRENG